MAKYKITKINDYELKNLTGGVNLHGSDHVNKFKERFKKFYNEVLLKNYVKDDDDEMLQFCDVLYEYGVPYKLYKQNNLEKAIIFFKNKFIKEQANNADNLINSKYIYADELASCFPNGLFMVVTSNKYMATIYPISDDFNQSVINELKSLCFMDTSDLINKLKANPKQKGISYSKRKTVTTISIDSLSPELQNKIKQNHLDANDLVKILLDEVEYEKEFENKIIEKIEKIKSIYPEISNAVENWKNAKGYNNSSNISLDGYKINNKVIPILNEIEGVQKAENVSTWVKNKNNKISKRIVNKMFSFEELEEIKNLLKDNKIFF